MKKDTEDKRPKAAFQRQKAGKDAQNMSQVRREGSAVFHFERSRLNNLFMEAVHYPLVVVCAGAGYGKTNAVHDFLEKYQATIGWAQLSERDNVGARFWENYIHTKAQGNAPFARAISKLGFPDDEEKINRYFAIVRDLLPLHERNIIVLDDLHVIEEPSVLHFIESAVYNVPAGTTVFLISRSTLRINTSGLIPKDRLFNVNEKDLNFTESEIAQYFQRLKIPLQQDNLYEIMQDTEGWAFAVNLIARSYQKAPGYGGYLQNAMKINIFALMEKESWDGFSERLQCFLIRLSLIGHLSVDLIALLAGEEKELIAEMERQSAYVRRDNFINAYLIHPLFLEFLSAKQESLTEEQKQETYRVAGDWCKKNGFKVDALSYYEKKGDYDSIVSILIELPAQIPQDIAKFAVAIFDRIPAQAFHSVEYLAVMHLRVYMSLGLWQKSIELAEYYEEKFIKLPAKDPFVKRALSGLYYNWALLRILMCVMDDRYDFDLYFEKFSKFFSLHDDRRMFADFYMRLWSNRIGSSRKGAPEEYIDALSRSVSHISHCIKGFMSGEIELAWGELHYFQGNVDSAQPFVTRALELARENKQFGIIHRALIYTFLIAASEGNYAKMEKAMNEIKPLQNENGYVNRFVGCDLSSSLYYSILRMPEKISEWFKQDFLSYGHTGFSENAANHLKIRFCYLTGQYAPILAYIREMTQRESYLFGRVRLLSMEACVHYKMKNKTKALTVLSQAYKTASPNNLWMFFIEMGKDMRTLTSSALRESEGDIPRGIPREWLEDINRKSSTYAKNLAHVITEYRKANHLADNIVISQREKEILIDLSHGLSRADIAASRKISMNTVKMFISNVYDKLGAENLADLIRIAVERKMI